jgi:uncharacterized protein YndB with AHSA1/START domain
VDRSLTHSTFAVERHVRAPVARAFRAFADPQIKAMWFHGPDGVWSRISAAMDFREGGREHSEGRFGPDGPVSRFDATYHEIVANERIVYSYEMRVNGERLSVSLASVEFNSTANGTPIVVTEQGVYFDHHADNIAERQRGTEELLAGVAAAVEAETQAPA